MRRLSGDRGRRFSRGGLLTVHLCGQGACAAPGPGLTGHKGLAAGPQRVSPTMERPRPIEMLETAELGHRVTPKAYSEELPLLRAKLLDAHFALRSERFAVIVIVSGADGAGKGDLVHRLNEWLDPRGVETHAFGEPSDEERERPPFWRFWRAMPGRGRIGIFFGSWYTTPIVQRVYGDIKERSMCGALERIASHERMLADDGALIVKLWLHLPRKEQRRRLNRLESENRIAPSDWKHFKLYNKFTKVSERALQRTDTAHAPWHVIEATDRRHRELAAGKILLDALSSRLKAGAAARALVAAELRVK